MWSSSQAGAGRELELDGVAYGAQHGGGEAAEGGGGGGGGQVGELQAGVGGGRLLQREYLEAQRGLVRQDGVRAARRGRGAARRRHG